MSIAKTTEKNEPGSEHEVMPSSSTSQLGRLGVGLLALALAGAACRRDDARQADSNRQADPGRSIRRGVEPAPARGEDRDNPAGERPPDERTQSTMILRDRIERLDQKLASGGQALSSALEEERRLLGQDFDALQRASESEWKDYRDRIDRRLESMTTTVDQMREPGSAASR